MASIDQLTQLYRFEPFSSQFDHIPKVKMKAKLIEFAVRTGAKGFSLDKGQLNSRLGMEKSSSQARNTRNLVQQQQQKKWMNRMGLLGIEYYHGFSC